MDKSNDDNLRVDRIKQALQLETDSELAQKLKTQHPRISSWRTKGFYKSTAILIDLLLDVIDQLKKSK